MGRGRFSDVWSFERSTKLSPSPTAAPAADGQPASAAPTPRSVDEIIESDVPARLDRLPWGSFHTLVVTALGVTWILDGLEVTLAGSLAGALKQSPVLHFS